MLIKCITDDRRPNRFGKFPVKILISNKGKRKFISTGIYANNDEFDNTSGLFIASKKSREYMQKNSIITTMIAQINDIIVDIRKFNKPVTIESITKAYEKMNAKNENDSLIFNDYFRKFIDNKTGRTKDIYFATLHKIEKYFPGKIYFEDVDKAFIKSFIQKMSSEKIKRKNSIQTGLSVNAQGIHLRNMRAVINEAINDGIISLEYYPFRKFKIEKEETTHRNISVEELRKLFEFQGTDSENYARDIAKLIFMLIGINASDLFNLHEISNEYINYRRCKTGRLYSIKLEPETIELFNKFKGNKSMLLFKEQFNSKSNFLKKVNGETIYRTGEKVILKRGLNSIGDALGIDSLTTYTLRHTWATIAGKLDIPKETIARALGHGKKVVTDIYIDFDQTKIDNANRKVIDYVFDY